MTNGPGDTSHDRPRCGARKRDGSGSTCALPPGWGTDHPGIGACKLHGGQMLNHRKAAQVEQARRDVERFGGSREVDPATALLEEVHRSAATVEYLRQRVNELDESELAWGVVEEIDRPPGEDSPGGVEVKRRAAPNVWVVMYRDERKHLAAVSKAALDAGVDQAVLAVFQQIASSYMQMFEQVLGELRLSEEQQRQAPVLLESRLKAIAGGAA